MTSACRPLTAWRHLAALLCTAAIFAPGPAGAEPCTTCPRSSFGDAPRSYAAGDGPQAAAVADFDRDGRQDLVVASNTGGITVLRGAPGGYGAPQAYAASPAPRGVATADFDFDGNADVVAALGTPGRIKVFPGDGIGGLDEVGGFTRALGNNLAAVVVDDFDGNGTPDVAVASEGSNEVFVLPGDGAGGFGTAIATPVGTAPRALVTGFFNADTRLDLAVACSGSGEVWVLLGNGNGAFTPVAAPKPAVGTDPWSIAAGSIDANGTIDLVTANYGDDSVSILKGNGDGTFAAAVRYDVDPYPTGVALVQVGATARPDIVVSAAGTHTVSLLLDDGGPLGGFSLPAISHPVRSSPQAVVPVDADADGLQDVAVPCKNSDEVVVLLTRPPSLREAPRVAVGAQPLGAVAADLDKDGDLDLAVANTVGNSVSVLSNADGYGTFAAGPVLGLPGGAPTGVVAADFDGDGILDLAANDAGGGRVRVFRGLGGGTYETTVWSFRAGLQPDDLAAADVDRDGRVDLLVVNKTAPGTVSLLRNLSSPPGTVSFSDPTNPALPDDDFDVGDNPTAIFVAELDGDEHLDFAVANDALAGPDSLTVRYGDGTGQFAAATLLTLLAGDNPLSLTGADFDVDGDVDLAVGLSGSETVAIFERIRSGFAAPDRIPAPDGTRFAVAADLNRDGNVDLAVAAMGVKVLRGKGSLALAEPFEKGEDVVAGRQPGFVVVADWNDDGWPDVAVVNEKSNDVSILLNTACQARRLEVIEQPAQSCRTGSGPYPGLQAVVETRDDGGNLACPVGDVTAAIVPGTGTTGATLTGAGSPPFPLPSVSLSSGVASFKVASSSSLTIDKAGRRYRLQFALPGLQPVLSRSFTLGAQPVILGPTSFCPSAQATYAADPAEGSYDAYRWTLNGAPSPFAFTPSVVLKEPLPLSLGSNTLTLQARVDSCALSTLRTIWYRVWLRTTLSPLGPTTVCVDCLGGTVKPSDEGGGAVVSRQWGYRTVSGGPITPIGGETAGTYVVKGTDFPGPGTYYLVVTTGFTCPSTPSVSAELPIVVSAVVQSSEVQSLAVTSRGASASGENLLQWVNSTGTPEKVRIRWNKSPRGTSACVPPVDPVAGAVSGELDIDGPLPAKSQYLHSPLEANTAHCYAVFVRMAGSWAPGRIVKARPFDASGPVKWAYSTGATAVVPPVVGRDGLLVMSNDRTVHSLTRGGGGGVWPALWMPGPITGVAYSRSPVVPLSVPVNGADSVLLVGDDAGDVHAVNAKNGQTAWGPVTPSANATITGAPGAILRQYGGVQDLVLVGTRNKVSSNPSDFFGLSLSAGATVAVFNGGGTLGPINGTPAVDYATQRVYFASRSHLGGPTLWCVQVNASAPALSAAAVWSRTLGDVDGSPVLRNGRVYVGANSGVVYSLDAATGLDARTFSPGDGPVKGFLFPDRRNDNLIFATSTKVWSVSDATGTFGTNWTWTMPAGSPSIVLYWPQTNYVYVGGGDGKLWQLNFTYNPGDAEFAKSWTLGDGTGQIGAPTLDIGVAPPDVSAGKKLLIVGSESGVLYGVEVPLP